MSDTLSGKTSLYERIGERTTQPFAVQLLDRLHLQEGCTLIDVAAGTGGLAVEAAERGASVLATDINPSMVHRAGERLQPFPSSAAMVMDFRALAVGERTFDISVSHFGVLAYPEWRQGLDELVRVTRPNGQVALTIWTHEDDCSPAHLLRRVYKKLFPSRELWPANFFPTFRERDLLNLLTETGCTDVVVDVSEATWTPFSSPDVVIECDPMFKGFPGYQSLDESETALLHDELNAAFHFFAGKSGTINLPTRAYIITARKV